VISANRNRWSSRPESARADSGRVDLKFRLALTSVLVSIEVMLTLVIASKSSAEAA
jgi:hypothetical protein